MKIITIIGARPQFIKACNISRELANRNGVEEIIVHTGQHFDDNLSSIFFEQMFLSKPKYNLGIGSLSHGFMTGLMIQKIEEVLITEKPDLMLLYGDTNSTLAGAIAASKIKIDIAHVEAGLRSFNMNMPEEINRILTDRISKYLFCPTIKAVENLHAEGFQNFNCEIMLSGDVMYDALLHFKSFAKKPNGDLPEKYILTTIHREENTEDVRKLSEIFKALNHIAEESNIVLPIHPRTKRKLTENSISIGNKNLLLIEPVGFLEMIWLLSNSELVLTDSGGLQKEAYFHHKACLTLREQTEWVELVENRHNVVVGSSYEKIISAFHSFKFNYNFNNNLYGDGTASKKIVSKLLNL